MTEQFVVKISYYTVVEAEDANEAKDMAVESHDFGSCDYDVRPFKSDGDDSLVANYKTTILWGECPEDGQEAITYKFSTNAELLAFNLGVNEMDGWLGYEPVEEGYVHNLEDDNG